MALHCMSLHDNGTLYFSLLSPIFQNVENSKINNLSCITQ
jgi:hypothetical protein